MISTNLNASTLALTKSKSKNQCTATTACKSGYCSRYLRKEIVELMEIEFGAEVWKVDNEVKAGRILNMFQILTKGEEGVYAEHCESDQQLQ